MNRDEILKLAEKAELISLGPTKNVWQKKVEEEIHDQCFHFAELLFAHWDNETKPAKVSPLEFVTITMKKENLIGRPIIWAEWPSKEQA